MVMTILTFGFYTFASKFITFPTKRTTKAMSSFKRKQSIGEQFYNAVTYPLTKIVAKFIHLESYRSKKLAKNLERAGINLTPAEYHAKAYVTSVLTILSAFLFIPLGLPIITMGVLMLGIVLYFKERQAVTDKLKKINGHILEELPRFIRTYNNSLKSSKDILRFMEKYRKVAGDEFKYDLDILITELKTGNTEEALQRFDDRVNIPQLSTFVSGVIGTSKGINQETFFYLMEQDMKILARENIKREIAKRPGKIKKATIAVGVMMFILYLYPIFTDLKNGLGIFN